MKQVVNSIEDLNSQLKNAGDVLCVVFCYTKWCTPCKSIIPKFEEIHKTLPQVIFLEIDMDHQNQISFAYDIRAVPTFLFIRNGNVLDTLVGNNPDLLIAYLEKYMQTETCKDTKSETIVGSPEQQDQPCNAELGEDNSTLQTESNVDLNSKILSTKELIEQQNIPVEIEDEELVMRFVEDEQGMESNTEQVKSDNAINNETTATEQLSFEMVEGMKHENVNQEDKQSSGLL